MLDNIKNSKILMYHSIAGFGNGEVGAGLYCVFVEKFKQQMEYLVHSSQLTAHSYVVTFDDGLLDSYTNAYPILKELGLKAYFFIIVSKIGTRGYMDWKQIKELKDEGMMIGSHGMTHQILTGLSEGDLDYEIRISQKILQEKLKCTIEYFSVPRGFYNQDVIKQVKDNGYKNVFTSNPKDDDGFKIGRIPIKGSWDMQYFIKVLNNGLSVKDRVGEIIKSSSKKILGVRNYDRLRTKILKI